MALRSYHATQQRLLTQLIATVASTRRGSILALVVIRSAVLHSLRTINSCTALNGTLTRILTLGSVARTTVTYATTNVSLVLDLAAVGMGGLIHITTIGSSTILLSVLVTVLRLTCECSSRSNHQTSSQQTESN